MSDEDYKKVFKALESAIPDYIEDNHKKSLKSRLKYGNEFSLRTRLKRIFKDNQENLKMFIKSKGKFIITVVDTRNYLTHYDQEQDEPIVENLELLIQKLKILLEICLLKELGFSSEEIKDLFSRNRRYSNVNPET